MPYPLSLELQPKTSLNIKQLQHLIMSRQMQQAIHFLQMPVMEITPLVEKELEQNPVLEYSENDNEQTVDNQRLEEDSEEESMEGDSLPEKALSFDERDFEILRNIDEEFRDLSLESQNFYSKSSEEREKSQTILENTIPDVKSLFEHLLIQVKETFQNESEINAAEAIIGNFDERGFLATPLMEIARLQKISIEEIEKILSTIQTFHPAGVGARDLRESLLIQLKLQKKEGSLAYTIIEKHFEDLLYNRIPTIKKSLHCSAEEIGQAIDEQIAKLDLHPGTQLSRQPIPYIIPDVILRQEGEVLIPMVNDEGIPRLRLNRKYLKMMGDETLNKETKEFIRHKIVSAKWLIRNIFQRNSTLEKISASLVKHQGSYFFQPEGMLKPLTMRELAEELQMHESTIARAVSNKYIDTPRGLLPLRFFFTNALSTKKGEVISSQTVKDLLQEIINKEDKSHPLSDEAISALMKNQGIQCARRTVAKYRTLLSLGSAQQRRKF